MNHIQKIINSVDCLQQRYRLPGFIYAVIKKYGEDQAGYQAALLTYYAFLSLFPLLLVVTTLTTLIAGSHPELQHDVIKSLTDYFPVLGDQLSSHVNGIHKSGIALVIGILFSFYGARGVADAFRNGVNHVWRVPVSQRDGFPKSQIKSLILIGGGGSGLILASIISGFAAAAGQGMLFRGLSLLLNIALLFGVFSWLLNISLPHHLSFKDVRAGALTAAIGLVILQSLGSILLARELRTLDAVYSYFATTLGLLFWLYLQTQVLYYSVEVAVVRTQNLWPRSLISENATEADKRAFDHRANEARETPMEHVETEVSPKSSKTASK